MTQQQLEGIVRHSLTLLGAIVLIFFSDAQGLVGELIGSGVMLSGVIWSLATKSGAPLIDKIRGVVNHSIAIVSAFLIYFGQVELNTTIEGAVATLLNLLPFILSFFDKSE